MKTVVIITQFLIICGLLVAMKMRVHDGREERSRPASPTDNNQPVESVSAATATTSIGADRREAGNSTKQQNPPLASRANNFDPRVATFLGEANYLQSQQINALETARMRYKWVIEPMGLDEDSKKKVFELLAMRDTAKIDVKAASYGQNLDDKKLDFLVEELRRESESKLAAVLSASNFAELKAFDPAAAELVVQVQRLTVYTSPMTAEQALKLAGVLFRSGARPLATDYLPPPVRLAGSPRITDDVILSSASFLTKRQVGALRTLADLQGRQIALANSALGRVDKGK